MEIQEALTGSLMAKSWNWMNTSRLRVKKQRPQADSMILQRIAIAGADSGSVRSDVQKIMLENSGKISKMKNVELPPEVYDISRMSKDTADRGATACRKEEL